MNLDIFLNTHLGLSKSEKEKIDQQVKKNRFNVFFLLISAISGWFIKNSDRIINPQRWRR